MCDISWHEWAHRLGKEIGDAWLSIAASMASSLVI